MSSCQIKEEMTVNKDGSGEYHLGKLLKNGFFVSP